jgi:nucleoside-diphosphate-sugar epimerase
MLPILVRDGTPPPRLNHSPIPPTLAPPPPPRYNPIKTIKTGFIGTMNMLGLAKRCRARFLLTSTSEVYGDPLQHPQTEDYWGNVRATPRGCARQPSQ